MRDSGPRKTPDTDEVTWKQVDAVFSAVLEHAPGAREDALYRLCAGNDALARSVRRLLRAEQRSTSLFARAAEPIQTLADDALQASTEEEAAITSPEQIGPYRLTRHLGSGGMSVVWKAERNDGDFDQVVAIKLLRRWIDSGESVQRFRAERRILAGLEHPNLARFIDGGILPDGLPYFVMEYVEGVPIVDYCDQQRLTIAERLALLGQVLEVVSYAHRRLVVHRDLKPSNILVTASGQVKLLDFGIAKVLDDDAAHAAISELTQTGGRMLTLGYASPEQVAGKEISTATDIYSLGVLLYQLLTGCSPYLAPEGQPAALQQAVIMQPPINPSSRVQQMVAGSASPADLAMQRRTTPARHVRLLRGDLDAICQVSLRKEPEHRYASVEQLGDDLRRHRERMPVLARRGNWRYRAARFARRNAWPLSAAVMIPLATMIAVALHVERLDAERLRATQAAALAQREAARSQQVTNYIVDLFRTADPANSGGRDITASELVERGMERSGALADDPERQATLLQVLGQVSLALGHYQRADDVLTRALASLDRVEDAETRKATILSDLGRVNFQLGRLAEAEQFNRRALDSLPDQDAAARAPALTNLGIIAIVTSRYDEAGALLEQAVAAYERTAPSAPAYATTLNALGTLRSRQGRHAEAVKTLQASVDLRLEQLGEMHPDTSIARGNLGIALFEAGDPAAAEIQLRQALDVDSQILGENHPGLAMLLNQLANVRRELGDPEGAIALLSRALDILREHYANDSPQIASALSGLGSAHLRLGEFDKAVAYLEEAVAIQEQTVGSSSREIAVDLLQLGEAALGQEDIEKAREALQRSLNIGLTLFGEEHELVGQAFTRLARVHWRRGNWPQAISTGRRGVTILGTLKGQDDPEVVALTTWLDALSSGNKTRTPPQFTD